MLIRAVEDAVELHVDISVLPDAYCITIPEDWALEGNLQWRE
jgi:hypothetical protein